jgi:hypothetical protein
MTPWTEKEVMSSARKAKVVVVLGCAVDCREERERVVVRAGYRTGIEVLSG